MSATPDMPEQKRKLKLVRGTGDRAGDLVLTLCAALKDGVLVVANDVHPYARAYLERLADEATDVQG